MAASEPVGYPQDDDFPNEYDDKDDLSPRSSYLSATSSFCSLSSEDSDFSGSCRSLSSLGSFRFENEYIGAPDIEERTDNFFYRKVFPSFKREDHAATSQKKDSLKSGFWSIPKPQKLLNRLGWLRRKSSTDSISHSPFSTTELSAFEHKVPGFQDLPKTEQKNIFLEKLEFCCVLYDFSDATGNLEAKDVKRKTLVELVDYVNNARLDQEQIIQSIKMASVNLFRQLQPAKVQMLYPENQSQLQDIDLVSGVEESKHVLDPSWPHLKLVYDFLLRLLIFSDSKLAKKCFDEHFCLRFVNLFDSQDPRERECVKTIFHRIYGKFLALRPFLRWTMINIFCEFIDDTEKHNGIYELLEILGSIISGFALPLKNEYKHFFSKVLIPLYKPRILSMYEAPLTYCVILFVEKEAILLAVAIRGLLKNWPRADWSKEVLFLGVLEDIMAYYQQDSLKSCVGPLFRQIVECLQSSHHKVAERALFLCNNHHVVNLVEQHQIMILPSIYAALENNARSHWNEVVVGLSGMVKEKLSSMERPV